MDTAKVLDSPVNQPQDDLLAMCAYARELASYIPRLPPPFTIGIYGEWGTGKTSFVHLVRHFLAQAETEAGKRPILFINFMAWPYRSSDELWRALILTIARELYEEEAAPVEAPKEDDQTAGFLDRLTCLLRRDAVIFQAPPAKPPSKYQALVARLDNTPESVSKNPGHTAQLSQEQALLAAIHATVTALGSLSPLLAGLRSIFGLGSGPSPAELLQRERNEATRSRIESIEELRSILRHLFQERASDRCVCVFIDDLDRCMPNVALDLLEAIKIFLDDARCVFIVAADEQLIGRGLQLRFKELAGDNRAESTERLLARKGQEYFEKIIQLGIRVPPPSPEQTYRYIAAQFPRWTPASDIIRTAIGDNPRRLKQYCNLLEYKFLVSRAQSKNVSRPTASLDLLDKLVQLNSRDPELHCLELLRRLAGEQDYERVTAEVERCLAGEQNGKLPGERLDSRLGSEDAASIYRIALSSRPISELLPTVIA